MAPPAGASADRPLDAPFEPFDEVSGSGVAARSGPPRGRALTRPPFALLRAKVNAPSYGWTRWRSLIADSTCQPAVLRGHGRPPLGWRGSRAVNRQRALRFHQRRARARPEIHRGGLYRL